MHNSMKLVSLISLALVIAPCSLYFLGLIGLEAVKLAALVGTVGWFLSTPMWMSRQLSVDAREVEI